MHIYFLFVKLALAVMRQTDHGKGMGARIEIKRFFQRLWQQCWWQPMVAAPGVRHGDDGTRFGMVSEGGAKGTRVGGCGEKRGLTSVDV